MFIYLSSNELTMHSLTTSLYSKPATHHREQWPIKRLFKLLIQKAQSHHTDNVNKHKRCPNIHIVWKMWVLSKKYAVCSTGAFRPFSGCSTTLKATWPFNVTFFRLICWRSYNRLQWNQVQCSWCHVAISALIQRSCMRDRDGEGLR